MPPGDLFWQLSNFFVVAVLLGAVAATSARLIWRQALAGRSLPRLMAASAVAAAAAQLLGLIVFGNDGRMATYALMVVVVASVLAWAARRS